MWVKVAGLAAVLGIAAAAAAQTEAQRPIRFPRQPSLSPDGKTVAFSYQGDLWTVPVDGGAATRITLHEAHDQLPAWSPDGKWIAYSSNREGNYDVWLIPAGSGKPRQLTFHSGDDIVSGWSPDGKQVLFTSTRETTRYPAIYTVDVEKRASRLVAEDDATLSNAAFSPDGQRVVCTRGGYWTRKGYRGSGNSELIQFPAAGGAGSWVLQAPENERWSLFTADGKALYYVSDKGGAANLWRLDTAKGKSEPVTRHTDGHLFYPTLARDGSRLVYEHDFALWSVAPGSEPREIRIFAPSDDRANTLRRETFTTGAQEAVLSPDGKQLAFVVHGEVFVQPAAGGEAVRLTETPQREEDVEWSPDSKLLAYASDRAGNQDLFVVDVKAKETRQLTKSADVSENSPVFSPDGKSLAFLRGYNGSELAVVSVDGGEARTLVRDPSIRGMRWSPDSRWIAFHRSKSHSAGTSMELFVTQVADGKTTNVTRYPGLNYSPSWSADGKKLYFISDRSGNANLWSVSLLEDETEPDPAEKADEKKPEVKAGEKAPVEVKIDLDEIHRRARQVTRVESSLGGYALSPDGKTLVFAMTQLGRTDLWRVGAEGGTPTRLTQSGEAGDGLQFSPDGARVLYRSGGGIRSLTLASPQPAAVAFRAPMEVDTPAELLQMFDEAWRKTRDAFYDEKLHGADWNRVRETYRPVVEDLTYKEDFYTLFALVLGELNASHTGLSGSTGRDGRSTASLGVVLDDAYPGPGVRVKSVVRKGPADRNGSRLQPGDLILKVDGKLAEPGEAFYSLLADRAGQRLELLVNTRPGEEGARTVKLRPVTLAQHRDLEYDRWVREREEETGKLSGGKLGYLHLSRMDPQNLEKFRRAVFGDMQQKDGMVLDLRFNPGGSIADEMLAILQDKVFSYRTIRGDASRLPAPLQVFTKPVIVLINQLSTSNAEAFPWGFKALKLGKVVGVATPGAVIGTGSTTLIDGSVLRTPGAGCYTLDGINMENNGCPPDIAVENTPEDVFLRRDRQLERGVQELLKQLGR